MPVRLNEPLPFHKRVRVSSLFYSFVNQPIWRKDLIAICDCAGNVFVGMLLKPDVRKGSFI